MNNIPHAHDLELAVLGAAMMTPAAAEKLEAIPAAIFYNTANLLTCQAIQELRQAGSASDLLLVKEHLKKTGRLKDSGGGLHLIACTEAVANDANFDYHLTILKEKYMQRQMIAHYQEGVNRILSGADVFEEIWRTEEKCNEIVLGAVGKVTKGMDTIVREYLEKLEKISQSESRLIGIPSGIRDLDGRTRGWKENELIIIAARPAMGKSDLALWLSLFASHAGFKTGFISLEMGEYQCMNRLIAMQGEIPKDQTDSSDAHTRKLVTQAASKVKESGIRIIDAGGVDIAKMKLLCKKLVREGCKMIVIDYLQLVNMPGKERHDLKVGEVTQMLKTQIAKEYGIPVILLSQLSRAVEQRGGDKRPLLSDLRDSGNIEQDADAVIFPFRPEYYGFETDDEGNSTLGMMELIIGKLREGKTGTIKAQYFGKYGRVLEWEYSTPDLEGDYVGIDTNPWNTEGYSNGTGLGENYESF